MNTRNCTLIFVILLVVNACNKPKDSVSYKTLGTYDATGKPNYLASQDNISDSLLSFIDTSLPPNQNVNVLHPELLDSTKSADVRITQQSDVYMTFVTQGASLTNAIAFYTYPTNQPPTSANDVKTLTYVFPNSGYLTPLQPGDKVKIGTFTAGTSVGFMLLQGGWDLTNKKINNNVEYFWTTDILNPELDRNLKKHAIVLNFPAEKKSLIGFEDYDREKIGCDNDFNDVVVYCTVTP